MAYWIVAACTESVGALRELDVLDLVTTDRFCTWFNDWTDDLGIPEDEANRIFDDLRFDPDEADPNLLSLRFRPGSDDFIRISRWSGPNAAEELREMLDDLADSPAAPRIRETLGRAVETVAIELKAGELGTIAHTLAWWTALRIAERGAGLVNEDHQTWWDPATEEKL